MPSQLELTHRIRIHAEGFDNEQLEELAGEALDALAEEAYGCALGPVASIVTSEHIVELTFQTVAPTSSSRASKMATIYGALEGKFGDRLGETDTEQVRDIVAA